MDDASSLERAAELPGHGSWIGTLAGSSESLVDSPGQESARFTTRSNLADQALVSRNRFGPKTWSATHALYGLCLRLPCSNRTAPDASASVVAPFCRMVRFPHGSRPTPGRWVPMSRAHVRRMWNWKRLSQRETHDSRLRGRWSRGMTALPG